MGCYCAIRILFLLALVGCAMGRAQNACRADGGLPAEKRKIDPRGGLSLQATLTEDGAATLSLQEALSHNRLPHEAWRLYRKAVKADRKGNFEAAEQLTESALQTAPRFFQAHAGLAVLRLREGRIENAETEIGTALRMDPHYLPGVELLGIAAFFRGDAKDARRILGSVVSRDPGRAGAHYFLGRALCETGQGKSADEEFEIARRLRMRPQIIQEPLLKEQYEIAYWQHVADLPPTRRR